MAAKNGRAKGKNFERWIAKRLGDWWGCVFRRTPSSGGWDKLAKDGKVMASGDIIAPAESGWPCSCEMKNREGWCLESIVAGTSKEFVSWWKQCADDAKKAGKEPMLIFTRAHKPVFVAIRLFTAHGWWRQAEMGSSKNILHLDIPAEQREALIVLELESMLDVLDKGKMKRGDADPEPNTEQGK
jgi:hypothetical protein